MRKFTITKPHSTVDLITNSSTIIFTCDNSVGEFGVKELLRYKAFVNDEMEWFHTLSIYTNDDGSIHIYSPLNEPDWFCDYVKGTFNVIDDWYG